jgi:hypothetical protein
MVTWGFVASYSDLATVGKLFSIDGISPIYATYVYVSGASGDIVWENALGEPQYLANAQAGQMYAIGARRILSSATVNGSVRTTAATNLVWMASAPVS